MRSACPYCSSPSLVWDSFYGSIICSSCGAVVAESLIDESAPLSNVAETREPPARSRGSLRLLERVLDQRAACDPLSSPVNKKALEVLRSSREVYEILVEISRYSRVKTRKLRVRIALALYLYLRIQGYSKSRALAEASRRAGASAKSLERILRSEKALVYALESELFLKRLKPGEA